MVLIAAPAIYILQFQSVQILQQSANERRANLVPHRSVPPVTSRNMINSRTAARNALQLGIKTQFQTIQR